MTLISNPAPQNNSVDITVTEAIANDDNRPEVVPDASISAEPDPVTNVATGATYNSSSSLAEATEVLRKAANGTVVRYVPKGDLLFMISTAGLDGLTRLGCEVGVPYNFLVHEGYEPSYSICVRSATHYTQRFWIEI